jgi:hypothetical protein
MSQLAVDHVFQAEAGESDWQKFVRLGGAVLFVQLGCLLISIVGLFAPTLAMTMLLIGGVVYLL